MQCHEIDYEIFSDDLPFVEVELDPGETVIAEAGAMIYLEDGIAFETKMGDGTDINQRGWNKLKSAAKRALAQESVFLTHFHNVSDEGERKVAFGASYPGSIVPIDLSHVGGEILVQKHAFLCAASGTKLDITFTRKLGTGLRDGMGFTLQRISGDGMLFLHAGGTLVHRHLDRETLYVDTACVVAIQPQIVYAIERSANLRSGLLAGEGLFIATLSGHGHVWLQSMPLHQLASRLASDRVG